MQNEDPVYVEADGERYKVVFSAELNNDERAALGHPAVGTPCACSRCTCSNDADMGTPEHPICGCCLADCPDVHPPDSANVPR